MTDLADEGTARPGSTLELRFSRPVDPTSVARALRVTPATAGRLVATADPGQAGAERFLWVPDAPLAPGTPIAFHLAASVGDADGLPRGTRAPLRDCRGAPGRAQPAGGAGRAGSDRRSRRFSEDGARRRRP
jgi:hypothetical protein